MIKRKVVNKYVDKLHRGFVNTSLFLTFLGLTTIGFRFGQYYFYQRPEAKKLEAQRREQNKDSVLDTDFEVAPILKN